MRTFLLSLTAAAAVFAAAPGAGAMTAGNAGGVLSQIQNSTAVQEVRLVCRHRFLTSRERCREVVVCRHGRFSSNRVCS